MLEQNVKVLLLYLGSASISISRLCTEFIERSLQDIFLDKSFILDILSRSTVLDVILFILDMVFPVSSVTEIIMVVGVAKTSTSCKLKEVHILLVVSCTLYI